MWDYMIHIYKKDPYCIIGFSALNLETLSLERKLKERSFYLVTSKHSQRLRRERDAASNLNIDILTSLTGKVVTK